MIKADLLKTSTSNLPFWIQLRKWLPYSELLLFIPLVVLMFTLDLSLSITLTLVGLVGLKLMLDIVIFIYFFAGYRNGYWKGYHAYKGSYYLVIYLILAMILTFFLFFKGDPVLSRSAPLIILFSYHFFHQLEGWLLPGYHRGFLLFPTGGMITGRQQIQFIQWRKVTRVHLNNTQGKVTLETGQETYAFELERKEWQRLEADLMGYLEPYEILLHKS